MSRLRSIVVGSDCDGVLAISRLEGVLGAWEETGSTVRSCPFSLLRF